MTVINRTRADRCAVDVAPVASASPYAETTVFHRAYLALESVAGGGPAPRADVKAAFKAARVATSWSDRALLRLIDDGYAHIFGADTADPVVGFIGADIEAAPAVDAAPVEPAPAVDVAPVEPAPAVDDRQLAIDARILAEENEADALASVAPAVDVPAPVEAAPVASVAPVPAPAVATRGPASFRRRELAGNGTGRTTDASDTDPNFNTGLLNKFVVGTIRALAIVAPDGSTIAEIAHIANLIRPDVFPTNRVTGIQHANTRVKSLCSKRGWMQTVDGDSTQSSDRGERARMRRARFVGPIDTIADFATLATPDCLAAIGRLPLPAAPGWMRDIVSGARGAIAAGDTAPVDVAPVVDVPAVDVANG